MTSPADSFEYAGPGLKLNADVVEWDTAAFGFPVAQIETISLLNNSSASLDYEQFRQWRDTKNIRIVSCRLPQDQLAESMFLESMNFRFVEMVVQPTLTGLQGLELSGDGLTISSPQDSDLEQLRTIAETSFRYERYHVDPRVDSRLADKRYGRWVTNSFSHPTQRLLKITDGGRTIAFFIVEEKQDPGIYWHLTAVAPQWQGKGYGKRVWKAMLSYHQQQGIDSVSTLISVRNVAVLNLYAKLGFRFQSPAMTLHWVRTEQ